MVEIWKPIKGYEGLYEVSNKGRIKALAKKVTKGKCNRSWNEHFLKYGEDSKGYFRTALSKNGTSKTVKVHRIVAQAFIDNPKNKPQVNHIDGNKKNNNVENLEWCTGSENMQHACDNNLKRNNGEHNTQHKLTYEDVCFIRLVYQQRHSEFGAVALAKRFGVNRKTIIRAALGRNWKGGGADVKRNIVQASN